MCDLQVRLGTRGKATVPREVRERLGRRTGDTLPILVHGQNVMLFRRPEGYTDALQGLGKELWTDAHDYLDRERSSWV